MRLITKILQDADRGDGFGFRGMVLILNYNKVVNTGEKKEEKECRRAFLKAWPELLGIPHKRREAIHWLTFLAQWYNGGRALSKKPGGSFGKGKVCPLFTKTAREIYYKRYLIVTRYLEKLKTG